MHQIHVYYATTIAKTVLFRSSVIASMDIISILQDVRDERKDVRHARELSAVNVQQVIFWTPGIANSVHLTKVTLIKQTELLVLL